MQVTTTTIDKDSIVWIPQMKVAWEPQDYYIQVWFILFVIHIGC